MTDDWMKGRVKFGTPEHFVMIEEHMQEKDAEIERLREEGTVELAKALLEIERLRAPITMQEICLCAGEGKLSAFAVLDAANAVLRMRARRALEQKP